jgi:hypothetical protein
VNLLSTDPPVDRRDSGIAEAIDRRFANPDGLAQSFATGVHPAARTMEQMVKLTAS